LLKQNEEERLGYKEGIVEIKNHPWFKYFDWEGLSTRKLDAPYKPIK
jgi:hypothetical protein